MNNLIKYSLAGVIIFSSLAAVSSRFVDIKETQNLKFLFNSKYGKLNVQDYETISINKMYSFPSANKLYIKSISGNIKIYSAKGSDFEIKLQTEALKSKKITPESIVKAVDNQVIIDLAGDDKNQEGSRLFRFNWNESNLSVTEAVEISIGIPDTIQFINLESISSDTSLENINLNELNSDSVSGNVTLKNSNQVSIKLNSISGDAYLEKASFNKLTANSVSGDLSIRLATDQKYKMNLTTVSGDQIGIEKFRSENAEHRINIDTISGDLKMSL